MNTPEQTDHKDCRHPDTRNRRVLFVATQLDMPEAHMVAGLARRGIEAVAIVGPSRRHAAVLEAAGIPVHVWAWSRALWSPKRRELKSLLKGINPDIVHAFDNAALYETWRTLETKTAASIIYRGAPFVSWRSRRLYRQCRVSRIACLSGTVRTAMEQYGYPAEKLVTIYKGHDPAWYCPATAKRLLELGLPPGARLVGTAARWRDWKMGHTLAEAFQRLPDDPGIHLLFIGEVCDPDLKRIQKDPTRCRRIHFVGEQPDAASLLGACEVMVMPSNEQEGLCKAVLEAMAQGVPAIVSNVGGPSEIVRNGIEGLTVPPGDVEALAAAMQRLLHDAPLRRACGAQALARVNSTFALATTIDHYQALYRELAP
jgi:glycosyltransferase involved in cell wall biosynthesis